MTVPPYPNQGNPYGQPSAPPGQPDPSGHSNQQGAYGASGQQSPYGPQQPPYGAPSPYGQPQASQPPDPFYHGPVAGETQQPSSPPDPFYRGPVAGQPLPAPAYGPPGGGQGGYGPAGYGATGYGATGYGQAQAAALPYVPPTYPQTYALPTAAFVGEPPLNQPWYGIGFLAAVKRAFQKYATFRGRASRGEFWWFFLANVLIEGILMALWFSFGGAEAFQYLLYSGYSSAADLMEYSGSGGIFYALSSLWGLVCFLPNIGLIWRRLHDTGRSGGWWFTLLIPLVNFIMLIVLLVFLCQPSALSGSLYDQPGSRRPY
jgi:uncharacterized membrane protein YhaH (DUF805 family)